MNCFCTKKIFHAYFTVIGKVVCVILIERGHALLPSAFILMQQAKTSHCFILVFNCLNGLLWTSDSVELGKISIPETNFDKRHVSSTDKGN